MGTVEENKDDKYIASDLKKETDQERLSGMELTWDGVTTRHMKSLGVTSGWKCLDVGAGYGSITHWLARQVAPDGKVVATDIRTDLHRQADETVEIRQHDILKDELEPEYYNLVHCRALLQHLPEPEKALSNMASAVKPGGWLLIEEFDNTATPSYDSTNSSADFLYKFMDKAAEIMMRMGPVNPGFGRNVRSLIEKLSLQEIGNEGTSDITRGGEPWAQFIKMSYQTSRMRLEERLTGEDKKILEDMDKVYDILDNPSVYFMSSTLCSAWGKKPK